MVFSTEFKNDFTQVLKYGSQFRFRYFTKTFPGGGSYYDDSVTLAQSGADVYTSGLIQSLDNTKGSADAILLEQGKILQNDSRLFVPGSIITSGIFTVGAGSPSTAEYSVIEQGINAREIGGVAIYKKIYLRFLPNGSLLGE